MMYDGGGFPRLDAAAAMGPEQLLAVWEDQKARGEATDEVRIRTARHLIRMAHLDDALEILGGDKDGVGGAVADGLRALGLDKRGAPGDADRALEILERLRRHGVTDSETMGLLAGRHKRFGRTAGDQAALQRALDLYRRAWKTRDTYPGINAAALALQLEGPDPARALALEVLTALNEAPCEDVDHWTYATRGEANLILGNLAESRRWYRRAVAADPKAVVDIVSMRDQARILLELMGHPADLFDDVFAVRTVAAFTGHRLDEPGRPARFPAELEDPVRSTLRERIRALDVGFGFSSAARGGDLIFLEELLDRSASARVFLPFPADAFVRTSVGDWEDRFRRVLAHPRVRVTELRADVPPDDELPEAFAACNDAIRAATIDFARPFAAPPTLLALWDGRPGRGPGSTAEAVEAWVATGNPREILDLSEGGRGKEPGPSVEPPAGPAPAEPTAPAAPTAPGPAASGDSPPEPGAPDPGATRSGGPGATRDGRLVTIRPASPVHVEYEARHCLAIGIDAYAGDGPWEPLKNAARDALQVAHVLRTYYGFRTELLSGTDATKQRISSAVLDDLRPAVGPDDLVVVFFAGHGHTQSFMAGNEETGYIVPVDANDPGGAPDLQLSRLISMANLAEWSAALDARHLLFVFDSCFSGMMLKLGGATSGRPDPGYARLAITAGTAGQKVLDGPEGGHSPFATALMARLTQGAEQADGYFTSVELYSHLRRTAEAGFPEQTPVLAMLQNHGGGEILFRPAT